MDKSTHERVVTQALELVHWGSANVAAEEVEKVAVPKAGSGAWNQGERFASAGKWCLE